MRSQWTFELRQDRSGNVVSDRLHRDAREIGRLFRFQTRLARDCRAAGRQWIAGILKQILDRATLAGSNRAPWSFRKDIALHVTVVGGIGVDDAADRAVIFGDLGFYSAKRVAVTHDHDLAF